MIEIATNKDDIVFDPFMGVGSTGVATLELDRRFIGVELDESYYNAAQQRIETTLLKSNNSKQMAKKTSYEITEESIPRVCDSTTPYLSIPIELEDFFQTKPTK